MESGCLDGSEVKPVEINEFGFNARNLILVPAMDIAAIIIQTSMPA
jgi:hypothetical protein